jgi:hypothetical protein
MSFAVYLVWTYTNANRFEKTSKFDLDWKSTVQFKPNVVSPASNTSITSHRTQEIAVKHIRPNQTLTSFENRSAVSRMYFLSSGSLLYVLVWAAFLCSLNASV